MGLCAEQLYKMVLMFFQKNENTCFFQGILLNGFIFFLGFGQRLGLPLQNGFGSSLKTTNIPTILYKMVCSFFGKM